MGDHVNAELDTELLAAIHDAVSLIMRAAQRHGPLPPLSSPEFITASVEVRLAVLATGGASYVFADDTLNHWLGDDYPGGRYHRQHSLMPVITELQRRRYPPTGDRLLWVKYGPPPALAAAA